MDSSKRRWDSVSYRENREMDEVRGGNSLKLVITRKTSRLIDRLIENVKGKPLREC
ncbi:MAG: hypothetical protein METHAR1v1_1690007 [Methanothrix sp.]|nr:MAG: hypothetical protein METHAR1v1_1690007 [Methanothrix sp.]